MTENERKTLTLIANGLRRGAVGQAESLLYAGRLEAIANANPPAGTVRIRIAVMVEHDGSVMTQQVGRHGDSAAVSVLREVTDNQQLAVHFIEADVPLPVPQTIQAEVQP